MIKKKYSIAISVSDGTKKMSRAHQTKLINQFEKMLMSYSESFGDVVLKVTRFIRG